MSGRRSSDAVTEGMKDPVPNPYWEQLERDGDRDR